MVGITRDGRTYALRDGITYHERDLVARRVAPGVAQHMRRFSDRRGRQYEGDAAAAGERDKNGYVDVRGVARRVGTKVGEKEWG